jgi:hypothetical protein
MYNGKDFASKDFISISFDKYRSKIIICLYIDWLFWNVLYLQIKAHFREVIIDFIEVHGGIFNEIINI